MELNHSLNTSAAAGVDDCLTVNERRAANRHVSVMLTAKLEVADRQQPCRILNISSKGANIESLIELQVGQNIEIEFRSNLKSTGVVRWVRTLQAGVEFDAAIDLNEIWKRSDVSIKRIKPRPPRFCCFAPGVVEYSDTNLNCNIIDISSSGMRLVDIENVPVGATVMIDVEGLPRHRAKVVWSGSNSAGLKLVNAYKYQELEIWMLQQKSPYQMDGTC